MVRLISKQSRTSAGLKLTKLFDIDDFSVAKDSGNILIIIIYCYFIIITSFFFTSQCYEVSKISCTTKKTNFFGRVTY